MHEWTTVCTVYLSCCYWSTPREESLITIFAPSVHVKALQFLIDYINRNTKYSKNMAPTNSGIAMGYTKLNKTQSPLYEICE